MQSKSVVVQQEKPYSKQEISLIKKSFAELEKFRESQSILDYIKKRRLELKAKIH